MRRWLNRMLSKRIIPAGSNANLIRYTKKYEDKNVKRSNWDRKKQGTIHYLKNVKIDFLYERLTPPIQPPGPRVTQAPKPKQITGEKTTSPDGWFNTFSQNELFYFCSPGPRMRDYEVVPLIHNGLGWKFSVGSLRMGEVENKHREG